MSNTTASTSTTTGALVVAGGVGIAGALYVGGAFIMGSTTIYATTMAIANSSTNFVAQIVNTAGTAGSYGMFVAVGAATDTTSVLMNFYSSGIVLQGQIVRNGTGAIAYATSSDIRGKQNRELVSLDGARAVIDALKVWDFDKEGNAIRGVGLIAQEAYEVNKYFAHPGKDDDEWWTSEKSAPVPYLIANMQQANMRLDALEKRIP